VLPTFHNADAASQFAAGFVTAVALSQQHFKTRLESLPMPSVQPVQQQPVQQQLIIEQNLAAQQIIQLPSNF
jgi:hypothetical protein